VQERLRRRDDDDRVRVDERRVDADPGRELDQLGVLDVVDDHAAGEAPREPRRDEAVHVAGLDPPRESSGDEQRLAIAGDAGLLELGRGRVDRASARVELAPGDRQRRRLDDDRRPPAAGRQPAQRLSAERIAQRLTDGRAHVGNRVARRRRDEHDRVVRRSEHLHARPREQGDAFQGIER
jgi:hypothetical protein